MKLSKYVKPKQPTIREFLPPKGVHVTITEVHARVYFSSEIVETFKMLSHPPSFAQTETGEWCLIFDNDPENSFSLKEDKGAYYFNHSDFVHRILQQYSCKKLHFTLIETVIPFAFLLVEVNPKYLPKPVRKKYGSDREVLEPVTTNHYDTIMAALYKD